jgi:transposase
LEERAKWPLAVVAEQPDLTLEEIVAAMQKRRIAGSRTGVWQLFARHDVTFKKDSLRAAEQLWPDVAHARRCWR